ncbi:MAG TPA: alkaline phosphatase family protein [Candidatus Baltobacteraceae bacterium]|nr:alkaline phosphatase family protein [Candidatus Baltobacteraceae bacterium]
MAGLSTIEHVVLLCMENRSFDHYLGALARSPSGRGIVDGLTDLPPAIPDLAGTLVPAWQIDATQPPAVSPLFPDVPHGRAAMLANWNDGKNDGFLRTYQSEHQHGGPPLGPAEAIIPVGYYTGTTLPVLYALAQQFTVCDRWFSSMLSSTWPNRKYLHSGTRDADDDTQIVPGVKGFETTPIYAFLENAVDANGKPLTWKSYFSDLPFLAFWYGFAATHALRNFATVDAFVDDCRDDTLPSVSIVDPPFTLADDHPPHDPALGQKFIGLVVDALTNSRAWETSVLILLYDEAGGFFDHAPPPATGIANDLDANYGFRVPALVVSPYARSGVSHTLYDHTSFIASLRELWNLDLESTGTTFGVRWPHAHTIWDTLDFGAAPHPRGTYTGDPLTAINFGSGVRDRLGSPLGQFESLLERIFVLPELKALDRRADVFSTLGAFEDKVVTLKRMLLF